MKMENPLEPVGRAALAASREMLALGPEEKAQALRLMAAGVRSAAEKIVRENGLDMEEARKGGRNAAFLDRLLLTPERVEHMARGMEQVAALPDPVGECIREWTRPNGLHIRQVRVPLGVIGFIYESRGTVTCDAAALCLKSGNAVILRGGSESLRTNRVLAEVLRAALKESAVPADAVQLLDSGSRDEVRQLCELDSFLNVVIPRGGKGLIRAVTEYARVPVLKHLDGVCHVYVDAAADLKMAVNVLDDAKTQRPGVCNAAETLLVDAAAAERFLPMAAERMRRRAVECRVCERSRPFFGPEAVPAEERDWSTEYEDLILSVKVVDGVRDAVEHINRYGSHHSDSIITEDGKARDYFMSRVDSACVYHNCSTRFSDGEEFGFGAEIGIGTDKFHARGPMALRELTSYKYVIEGPFPDSGGRPRLNRHVRNQKGSTAAWPRCSPLVHTPEEVPLESQPVADASVETGGAAAEVRIDIRKNGAGVTHRNGDARACLHAGGSFPGSVHAESCAGHAGGRQRCRGFPVAQELDNLHPQFTHGRAARQVAGELSAEPRPQSHGAVGGIHVVHAHAQAP